MNEYATKHNDMWVSCLTAEQKSRTCGYWYTVTSNNMAHTAFANAWALHRWMWERGLRLTVPLPAEVGTWDHIRIDGAYTESNVICEPEEWDNIGPVLGRGIDLSNGDYVEAIFTAEPGGTVRVRKLNPNCHWRKVYDYMKCDERRNQNTNGKAA